MPRPINDKAEAAYVFWASEGERNIRATAQHFETNERTVYYWKLHYGWDKRWADSLREFSEDAVVVAKTQLKMGLSAAADRLVRIIASEKTSDRDAILAVKVLFTAAHGLADAQGVKYQTLIDARQVLRKAEATEDYTVQELKQMASAAIEANLAATARSTRRVR